MKELPETIYSDEYVNGLQEKLNDAKAQYISIEAIKNENEMLKEIIGYYREILKLKGGV